MFRVINPGVNDWDVQLIQNGFTLEKGCKYRVKFKVTSTKARTIKLGLMDNNCQEWYGGEDISLAEAKERKLVVNLRCRKTQIMIRKCLFPWENQW